MKYLPTLTASLAFILIPSICHACACGCGIFEVGTASMLPQGKGGMIYLDYDYQDQNYNWSGSSRAPKANNDDKNIRTNFITLGAQYMFNRSWGIQAEMPYDFRHFATLASSGDGIAQINWGAPGDARIQGIYTGFFPDMSAGVLFGLKLPTGNFTHEDAGDDVDRDSEIGTGSTDVLLGGFFRSPIFGNNNFNLFTQINADFPVLIQASYRPGMEFDEAAGVYYTLPLGSLRISPVAQILASERTSDSGTDASSPVASGYTRLLLSPGIEFDLHPVSIYADVEFPVYQHMNGNQLVAPALFKVSLSYHF